jgi:hypothetical protein
MPNDSGSLTFRWLVGVLVTIVILAGGMLIADTKANIKDVKLELAQRAEQNKAKIECLEKEKLDKDQYYRDIREIKETMKDISIKIDKMRK